MHLRTPLVVVVWDSPETGIPTKPPLAVNRGQWLAFGGIRTLVQMEHLLMTNQELLSAMVPLNHRHPLALNFEHSEFSCLFHPRFYPSIIKHGTHTITSPSDRRGNH